MPIRGVEHRRRHGERDGERHERGASRQQATLALQRGGHGVADTADHRPQRACEHRPAAFHRHHHDAVRQQADADPRQSRPGDGPVADRDRRHTFGREHEPIAVARGQPVDRRRSGEQHDVDPEALPRRRCRAPGAAASGHDAVGAGVASRRHRHGQGGDDDADRGRHHRPDDCRGGRGTEAGGPEGDAPDDRGNPETDARPEGADEERLDRGEADELARRRAACAEQGVLAAPRLGTGRGDRGGEQPGEHHAGRCQDEEQHLGVEGVLAGGGERRREVVADDPTAGEPGLEMCGRRR